MSKSQQYVKRFTQHLTNNVYNLMFIGPCIIVIVHEWKTNLMTLAILFHLLCAQQVSDIKISIFRSLRLCWWITTSVVLFSVRCVLELLVRAVFGGFRFAGFSAYLGLASFYRRLIQDFAAVAKPLTELAKKDRQFIWGQSQQTAFEGIKDKLCTAPVLASACKTKTTKNRPHQKLQHTTNWEQDDRCGNSSTQSQAPEDGYINVRNMLST